MTELTTITADINRQLADPKVSNALLETTFKDFTELNMKKAIMEGIIRGFTFKNFLEKDVYAIKYGEGYSLITSIDYSRKVAMKSNIVGIGKPEYQMSDDGKTIISCTITVKRKVGSVIGEFTAEVYFDEYTTKKNLWVSKPRTMIAKVAEMHALRKACPEELSNAFVEEEMQVITPAEPEFDPAPHMLRFDEVQTLADLQTVWASMPILAKNNPDILARKNELKEKLTPTPPPAPVDPLADNEQPPV